ncbi:MAG: PAS domain-containing protein [Campylobacterales bacterium]|nr:PAS domain-containing protein [Campylobacterales bacterium]
MERKMDENDFIVSKTDLKGKISYCNRIFMEMAEYSEEELLGAPHSIIRHPEMPKAVFKLLWDRIQKKEEVFAYVLNRTKNKNEYWVFANVTASLDVRGKIIGYYSVRRKPNEKALAIIKPLYAAMLEAEKRGGIEASTKILTDLLAKKGMSYDELIIAIQE